ncbi:MAG: DUF6787 family protein [Chitinophagaceae bacterium]
MSCITTMFEKLQKKWKVGKMQLALIICTFAIGGSVTGYSGKKIMNVLGVQQDWLWTLIYILLITVIWPLTVLIISIPFGQFSFFRKYIQKIGNRIGLGRQNVSETGKQVQIAIFASGNGTNAQKIIEYFSNHPLYTISLIVCNKPEAGVLKIAGIKNIPALVIGKENFFHGDAYVKELQELNISFLVLAGFLWKLPGKLVRAYPRKIVNIHPALLPKYGGKGMYGNAVHEKVIAAKEKESGITIHYVDEFYDHGQIIFQATCPVSENDSAESLAQRIHALEHEHYSRIIENLLK